MSPMMMTSQMQRMLAASPHMALFGGMPPGGMPPRPPHGFPGNLMPGQREWNFHIYIIFSYLNFKYREGSPSTQVLAFQEVSSFADIDLRMTF